MFKFFKTKVGFTLVELLVVVLILGIIIAVGVPVFNNVAKNNRIKACCVYQRTAQKDAKDWCIEFPFNQDYVFYIECSKEDHTTTLLDFNHNPFTAEADISLLRDQVLDGNVPFCDAGGTYTVKVTAQEDGIPIVEVTCDGGDDGDCHKPEN